MKKPGWYSVPSVQFGTKPMRTVFLWFYCLPIVEAVVLILLVTAAFLLLRERLGNSPYWKGGILLLFLLWIGVILLGTLGQRAGGGNMASPVLMPFASYHAALSGGSKEIFRANFMNVVLFYPAGILGVEVLPKLWRRQRKAVLVTVLLVLLSLGIEYAQYRFNLGMAETDDVIHNALGALLGALAGSACVKFHTH